MKNLIFVDYKIKSGGIDWNYSILLTDLYYWGNNERENLKVAIDWLTEQNITFYQKGIAICFKEKSSAMLFKMKYG